MKTVSDWNNEGAEWHKKGDLAKARNCYEEAIKSDENNAVAFNNLAFLTAQERKWEEAVKLYDLAIKAKPDYSTAYVNRGNALVQQNKIQEAVNSYKQAIYIDDACENAWFSLARLANISKQFHEANEFWVKLLSLQPDKEEYAVELIGSYFSMNEIEKAGTFANGYILKYPNAMHVQTQLGYIFFIRQNYDRAKNMFLNVLKTQPENLNARLYLGMVLLALNDLNGATESFETLLEHHPGNEDAYINIGIICMSQKKFPKALSCFEHCLEKSNSPKAYYYKGVCLMSAEQRTEGKAILEAVSANPKHPFKAKADEFLEKLKA